VRGRGGAAAALGVVVLVVWTAAVAGAAGAAVREVTSLGAQTSSNTPPATGQDATALVRSAETDSVDLLALQAALNGQLSRLKPLITSAIVAAKAHHETADRSDVTKLQSDETSLESSADLMSTKASRLKQDLDDLSSPSLSLTSDASSLKTEVPAAVHSSSKAQFDFQRMIAALNAATKSTSAALEQLGSSDSGNMDIATMFQLQFHMQVMSQYVEAVSNVLSAVHNEMITLARTTKGQ
jgi:hypothetical protein